ncbi:peptidylprolyl isomerase [Lysobacter korlensis]|uniref:Peptidylprolyl isomerase n=1 Tax=Lysobacter korlensis TaxID=553636 RepID=A0ABV6RM23_9GAMM
MPSSRRDREAREARERQKRYAARQQVHQHKTARRKRDNLVAVGALVVVATLATVAQLFYFADGPGAPTPTPTASASADPQAEGQNVGDVPSPDLAEGRAWTGELVLNENVELGIELNGESAPQAVSVFLQEAQAGYYDGKTCHRLVQGETAGLLQCGSSSGDGASDPEFAFGPIENAPEDGVYPAGTIAMARGPEAFSQGKQFFVVFEDTQLPADAAGGYTVIGSVTSGLEALVSEIAAEGVDPAAGGEDGPPAVATTITRITIS